MLRAEWGKSFNKTDGPFRRAGTDILSENVLGVCFFLNILKVPIGSYLIKGWVSEKNMRDYLETHRWG